MPLSAGTGQSKTAKASAKQSGKTQDALKLLKTDHDAVENLFDQYERLKDKDESKKEDLIGQICTALTVHAQLEEEIFYPAAQRS